MKRLAIFISVAALGASTLLPYVTLAKPARDLGEPSIEAFEPATPALKPGRNCAAMWRKVYVNEVFGPTECCNPNADIKPNVFGGNGLCAAPNDGSKGTCVLGWDETCGDGFCDASEEDSCNCPADCETQPPQPTFRSACWSCKGGADIGIGGQCEANISQCFTAREWKKHATESCGQLGLEKFEVGDKCGDEPPVKYCTSSSQCRDDQICSTELGDCFPPPNGGYEDVCYGICQVPQECAKAGEKIPVIPDGPVCCPGLEPISNAIPIGEHNDMEEISSDNGCMTALGAMICSDCGNSICEEWENECNCPADCEVQPSDTYRGACWQCYDDSDLGETYRECEASISSCFSPEYFEERAELSCEGRGGVNILEFRSPCMSPVCGNNICEEGEASYCPPCDPETGVCSCLMGTCPQDCEIQIDHICGNNICEKGENHCTPTCDEFMCHGDCGDNYCPQDCSASIECPSYEELAEPAEGCEYIWIEDENDCQEPVLKCEKELEPVCGNDICEKGEANISDPGGCGPNADPSCLGPPAYFKFGTCPQDCGSGSGTVCTDSDDGKNYYEKGVTSGLLDGEMGTRTDHCGGVDSELLEEFYCEGNNIAYVHAYNCPFGCEDGACVREEEIFSCPLPGDSQLDIATDGEYLYLVAWDGSNSQKIYQMDKQCNVVEVHDSPGHLFGLSYGNDSFWSSSGSNGPNGEIVQLTRDFKVVRTFDLPYGAPQGTAFSQEKVWTVHNRATDEVTVTNIHSGKTKLAFYAPSNAPYGMAADNKYIWMGANGNIYALKKQSGEVEHVISSPTVGGYISGLTLDDDYIWAVDNDDDRLYRIPRPDPKPKPKCGNDICEEGEKDIVCIDPPVPCDDECLNSGNWGCNMVCPQDCKDDCKPLLCEDGQSFPTCDDQGNPINYFADPCYQPVCGNNICEKGEKNIVCIDPLYPCSPGTCPEDCGLVFDCPVYMLVEPSEGCEYIWTEDDNGCPYPKLECKELDEGPTCAPLFSNCSCSYKCQMLDPEVAVTDCARACLDDEVDNTIPKCAVIDDVCTELKEPIEDEHCATYIREDEEVEYCATCGDGVCEAYEGCTSSHISGGMQTADCGGLYCPQDCNNDSDNGSDHELSPEEPDQLEIFESVIPLKSFNEKLPFLKTR